MGWVWTAVLNGTLGVGAYTASRFAFGQSPGLPRALGAAVLGWAWLTLGLQALGATGVMGREAALLWVASGCAVGLAFRLRGRHRVEAVSAAGVGPSAPPGWDEVLGLGLALWAALWVGLPSLVRPVKVVSDGPIYHLYFAARWWKSHRLDLIATPFGENAATYFPASGDLWFTWLMMGLGGDGLAKVGQAPFLAMAWLAAFALSRRLGAGRPSAVIAAAWFVTSTPLLVFSFEANVDTVFLAGYLTAAYFFLRYALGDDGRSSLVLGALSAGCALGTKPPGVVFVPPLLALAAGAAGWKGRGVGGKASGALAVVFVPLTVSGFWYLRNALLTGNPLYPLRVAAFGRVWLPGWYGAEVMHLSQYYLPVRDWRSFADIMLSVLDPRLAPVWLAALAGAWRLARPSNAGLDRWVWVASGLAVLNVALYWLVIPYRTQQRFMLQALGLAAVPLARLFDGGRVLRVAGVGLLAVHLVTPQGWPFVEAGRGVIPPEPPWDFSPVVKNSAPGLVPFPSSLSEVRALARDPAAMFTTALVLAVGLGGSACLAWSCLCLARRRSARLAGVASLASLLLVGAGAAVFYPWEASLPRGQGDRSRVDPRRLFYPRFPDYYLGWLAFDALSGPTGTRVAYAGTNLTYFLMGAGLRNEVRYVNVDAHPGWLLHDYHRDATGGASGEASWPHPRPGWDRVHPDYHAWLANLHSERIELLVVARANPDEGPHNVADRSGFTIERRWADGHPESFELLYGEAERDPLFRIYRVKPPTGSS